MTLSGLPELSPTPRARRVNSWCRAELENWCYNSRVDMELIKDYHKR